MPEYTVEPEVIAEILVRVGHEHKMFGPGPAPDVKKEAARWLRKVCNTTSPNVRVLADIEQRSDNVPWLDGAPYWWRGDAEHGREYAAQFCERFPEWGRGR